ncbi:MAG: hypothetical protein JRD89_01440 [Deltaproteobacteria bacterium]|nr:hypothetical protein [Deltaproteobacteria bacterium]
MSLFDRRAQINIGGADFSNLDMVFSVEKDLAGEANSAQFDIYNLNPAHRNQVKELASNDEKIPVIFKAGYAGNLGQLFTGELSEGFSRQDGPEWVTTIRSSDGAKAGGTGRINKTFSAQATVEAVLKDLAKAVDVGIGNAAEAVKSALMGGKVSNFTTGVTLSGGGLAHLDHILKSCGLEYSIQDGELQIVPLDEALDSQAVVLSAGSGLLGVPEIGSDGIVKARALLIPELMPGRKVQIDSEHGVSGLFRVERSVFSGDTAGDDWTVAIEAK